MLDQFLDYKIPLKPIDIHFFLAVNAGSSSLKFNLISLPEERELISGNFEKIGLNGGD